MQSDDVIEQMTWSDLLPVLTADEATPEADREWAEGFQRAALDWNRPDWS
jgi:hypothetical protein